MTEETNILNLVKKTVETHENIVQLNKDGLSYLEKFNELEKNIKELIKERDYQVELGNIEEAVRIMTDVETNRKLMVDLTDNMMKCKVGSLIGRLTFDIDRCYEEVEISKLPDNTDLKQNFKEEIALLAQENEIKKNHNEYDALRQNSHKKLINLHDDLVKLVKSDEFYKQTLGEREQKIQTFRDEMTKVSWELDKTSDHMKHLIKVGAELTKKLIKNQVEGLKFRKSFIQSLQNI